MAKTELTKLGEKRLWQHTNKMGTFGCFEVTIGWFGKEIVDYITYDTNGECRCYEIKTSKSDFMSKANLTFVGHFNYFVMPRALYNELRAENNKVLLREVNSYGVGVYVFSENGFESEVKAKRRKVTHGKMGEILESMLRSTSREVQKFYREKPYWE